MITRREFDVQSAQEQHGAIARAESIIDDCLRQSMKQASNGVSISAEHFRGIPHAVIQVVLARYTAAGWKARYVSDQRDGDYVVLS